jgi:hypothetical protein
LTEDSGASPYRKLLIEWERRNRVNLDCHNRTERRFDLLNAVCAVTSILGFVVLGSVATSIGDWDRGWAQFVAVSVAAVAGGGSVLLAVRSYGSLADQHRTAARAYASISREIELATLLPDGSQELQFAVERIRLRWDEAARSAPNVPDRIRRRVRRERTRRVV